ncbi:MAG: 30S ribosomal protein S6e [Candidatus Nanohaloarchaea archaeon]
MQINIGTQDGEVHQIEADAKNFVGKTIGETFNGEIIDLNGYELEITGGSDKAGFPMRHSIEGSERKRVLIENGSGIREKEDGMKRRKSVRGNKVSTEIEQLNVKVVEEGSKSLEELLDEDEE